MTISEFKAWLEGFEAAIGDQGPSPEQWAIVKAKLKTVRAENEKLPPPYSARFGGSKPLSSFGLFPGNRTHDSKERETALREMWNDIA